MNSRITAKDRALITSALRRVFSRSDLRKEVVNATRIQHRDPKFPRVKHWATCEDCKKPTPMWKMAVDHREPVVPVSTSLEQMTWDEIMDRLWCDKSNLAHICKLCHDKKTAEERIQRVNFRKERKAKSE